MTYTPSGRSRGHLALVGKGIMYDAGGISLKPSDAMHALMKLDMSGAGDIFGAMTALRDLGCKTTVTGYLMCTDNMPSGTATRLGDVLTIRGGKTVEVVNADAEGRLVMADGMVLAVEDGADAIVTVATLTGAAMRTFGTALAPVLGNSPDLVAQLRAAGDAVDEPLWELPLVRQYRRQIDSKIADIKNMGGENAGTITAGLFLEDFVDGHAVRASRHLRSDGDGSRRRLAPDRRDRLQHPPPGHLRHRVPQARSLTTPAPRIRRDPSRMTEMTAAPEHTALGRVLDFIERTGNKVPHPVMMFLYLIIGVIVLSAVLAFAGVSVTEEIAVPDAVEVYPGLLRGQHPADRRAATGRPRLRG